MYLDACRDPKSASGVYHKLKAEGIEPGAKFREILAQILLKYSEPLPFEMPQQRKEKPRATVDEVGWRTARLLYFVCCDNL